MKLSRVLPMEKVSNDVSESLRSRRRELRASKGVSVSRIFACSGLTLVYVLKRERETEGE
jgi:hypothetical protein